MPKTDVMARLKSETADLHHKAERQEFQRRMIRGDLERDDYSRWLGQMLLVHAALERSLVRLCRDPDHSRYFAAVEPEQLQERNLLADLSDLSIDPDTLEPLPATEKLVSRIESTTEGNPLALLGYHYVLEGSKNGNRFVAQQLRPALGLAAGTADRYLDPYGDDQPRYWARFKEAMGEIDLTEEQIERLIESAMAMFEGIARLSEELQAETTAAA